MTPSFPFTSPSDSKPRSIFLSLFAELAGSFLAVVFPTSCLLCRGELTQAGWPSVCRDCWEGMKPWTGARCASCGLPMASDQMTEFGAGEASRLGGPARCTQCRLGEYEFDWARSYGVYAGSLRAAILQLKFHRRQRLGRRLGTALAAAWAEEVLDREIAESEAAVLVPVPLHPSRQRGRGFNQAEELGRGLARALIHKSGQAPRLETRCLRRVRATSPQSGLALRKRARRFRGPLSRAPAGPPGGTRGRRHDDRRHRFRLRQGA